MKSILFIGMSLNIGGAEKSLVNLLNMIDYDDYEVDLLLFQKTGAFLKQVPTEVNIIEIPEIEILFQSAKDSVKKNGVSVRTLKYIFARYIYNVICKTKWKQFDQIRLNRWINYYKDLIPNNDTHYDIAVAYAGGECAYYMFDKVCANQKVYYFHSDYSNINIDAELERQYVDKSNLVVTISDKCKESLLQLFPELDGKISVLQNLSSTEFIKKLAYDYFPTEYEKCENILKIVSVGRLINIKGFDMAIEAAAILKTKGIEFIWIVVGEGEERANLEKMIEKFDVSDCFKLVGLKENPYPYIKYADVLLQTSRFEGKSVVLDEARILKLPVIATNYNSAHDQIDDGVDGIIVEMNSESIALGIEMCDKSLLTTLKNNIKDDNKINDIQKYMDSLGGINV